MDQNVGLLEAVAENTEMGKNTLEQLLKMCDDATLCAEMKREQEVYRELNQRAHAAMADYGSSVRGQTAWAKAMTHMGICMETFKDKSTRKIAEMLIDGSNQGVVDCVKSLTDYPDADEPVKKLAKDVEVFQQESIERLKKFLG